MSSYLSIYVKPKEIDRKILLASFCRSSEIYGFFEENNLAGYAYDDDGNIQYTKLEMDDLVKCTQALRDELVSDKEKLILMKSLSDKSTIEDIMSWQEYIDEKVETINYLNWIAIMLDTDYNDVESIYTNID